MKILLSDFDIALIISGIAALLVGAAIFFSVGVNKIKPKHVAIIEKVDQFYCVAKSGWHYYMPIVYKRVGIYCVAPQQVGVTLSNGNKLFLVYQIEDAKTYHYKGINVQTYLDAINKHNENITTTLLDEEFKKIGVKFISIKAQ